MMDFYLWVKQQWSVIVLEGGRGVDEGGSGGEKGEGGKEGGE